MATERPVPRFFLLLMAVSTLLLGWVMYPIVGGLVLAAVLAGILWRPQQWLARHLRGRRSAAATILTLLVALIVIGPLATLLAYVVRDGADALAFIRNTAASDPFTELVARLPAAARELVYNGLTRLPSDLGEVLPLVGAAGGKAVASAGANLAVHGAFMLIALFSLLTSGDDLVDWIDEASPLEKGRTRALLTEFKNVSFAVIVSTLITSAVQAVAAVVGYLIAQVPNPIFFGIITFMFAFIPAIGAGAVCVVAAALLLVTGHPYMAIFLAVWGVVVVGLADNVVKPLLIKRGMKLHGTVVFFALVGGIAAFGALGLLLGPLVVAFFLALVRMYHEDFSPDSGRLPVVPGHSGSTLIRSE